MQSRWMNDSQPWLSFDLEIDVLIERIKQRLIENLSGNKVAIDLVKLYFSHRSDSIREKVLARKAEVRGVEQLLEVDQPDLWTEKQRTNANLVAMELAARKPPGKMTKADLSVLSRYSGWGGLSIKKNASKFPDGFPKPEERGLIHEYYTPTNVVREIARIIRPLVPTLPHRDGKVITLEPSAGIGRFVQAASGPGFDEHLDWRVIEWSALSSRMLQAMRADIDVFEGPFERWVRENDDTHAGNIGLLLSNPPYGPRGASITEDPKRDYREKRAYAYFLRRGLDLLAPGGMGVYLVPGGFITGNGVDATTLRDKILKRHHLSAAYRLPSGIFPGAMLVIDVLFFRARGLDLSEVAESDQFILEGRYFEEYPSHILGTEVGKDGGEDDQTKKSRWGYQVLGEFEGLPDLIERPLAKGLYIADVAPSTEKSSKKSSEKKPQAKASKASKAGLTRTISTEIDGLEDAEALAVQLGARVDYYLATASAQATDEHVQLWPELHAALNAWSTQYGNPYTHKGLAALARKGNTAIERFLSAHTKTGALIPGIATAPTWKPTYTGKTEDVVAFAEWLYRGRKGLTLKQLGIAWTREVGTHEGRADALLQITKYLPVLISAGWCVEPVGVDTIRLYPGSEYYSGQLWPRYDLVTALINSASYDDSMVSKDTLRAQAQKLIAAINPSVFEDIDGISPRQGWVPLSMIARWINEKVKSRWDDEIALKREEGLVVPEFAREYSDLSGFSRGSYVADSLRPLLGWINHDLSFFKVSKRKSEDLDEKRLLQAKAWEQSFRAWLSSDEDRKETIETAYNRSFKGYVQPDYGNEPLNIARWTKDGIKLHPHQSKGARRILANRGGLLAFDVGVGKTYTGIAIVARARQEGWCKRPVFLVPNSIAWKWEADIRRTLPDYRVAVIGSKKTIISRGARKGQLTSSTDTPQERASKWTRFQAGEYDVVILTYTALSRTRMNEAVLREYADTVEAIKREVALRQRNARKTKSRSERQEAVLKEGVAGWIAEKMELPESWEYDPGIAWDDIGIDMLIVDEAQNYKNLYMPEQREGGVPRFMGNAGEGSNRAWQLDFRCAAVRRNTRGTGIVLLSATPAKNSPLEFYNLLQYIDPKLWTRMGIRDPEQFIDRYLKIEIKQVIGSNMEASARSAVVGFMNLHELRDVLFRYADFKTAEDVGLKLPEPTVNVVNVKMNAEQERKYDYYVSEIEAALESSDPSGKAQMLGILARMALVSIHPNLDEKYDWKTAATAGVNPESPKFTAMAKRVLDLDGCGHIVFCDNVAAHRWIVQTLVKKGISEKRIAVLNANTAKNTIDRQTIAQDFNGTPEKEPKYDVVIANAIAYEGIDLQRRTCAIHHIDLPWEPATLQQRNGRGVRQGNTLDAIEVNYYFALRSQDGMRFSLIQGKRGWMVNLIESQDRDTNNPGAQMEMGPDEVLLMISRDPEKTQKLLDAVKAKAEAERIAKVSEQAARTLIVANARFRKAEQKGTEEAALLRAEGEELLKELSDVDPEAWPWYKWAVNVRNVGMLVEPKGGPILYEGLRVDIEFAGRSNYFEVGRMLEQKIGMRSYGQAIYREFSIDHNEFKLLDANNYNAILPEDDMDRAVRNLDSQMYNFTRQGVSGLGWQMAGNAFLEEIWDLAMEKLLEAIEKSSSYIHGYQKVPVIRDGHIHAVSGRDIFSGRVLPIHLGGWRKFLTLAPSSGLKLQELQAIADFWWGRKVPRGILTPEIKG